MSVPSSTPQQQPAPSESSGIRRRLFRPGTVALFIAGALLIGLLFVFAMPTLLQKWHQRRAHRLIETASELIAQGSWEKATKLLSQAFQIDRNNPELLRVMARTLDQTPGGTERSTFFWRQLITSSAATVDDRIAYGAALLRNGACEEARQVFDEIPEAARHQTAAFELKAALLRVDGHHEEARSLLRDTYLADAANPESQFKLALLDLNTPFPDLKESAVRVLWKIAASGSKQAIDAMQVLATESRLAAPKASELRALLDKTTHASDEKRFAVLNGVLRALPQERERIIDAETARQQARPFETTAPFFSWLSFNKENDRLFALLSTRDALRTAEHFLPFAATMERSQRWKELRDIIRRHSSLPVPPATVSLILARCARGLGESSDRVRSHLQECLKQASLTGDRINLMAVGATAEEFGDLDTALEAYAVLSLQPRFRLAMLERIMQIRQRQRNLPAMLEIAGRLLDERPANRAYIESWCYLALLAGTEMERAAALGRQSIHAPDPARTHAFIRAFSAYRQGDLESARQELLSVNATRLSPGQRAVCSGILRVCGRSTDAFQLAEKIPQSILLTEEIRFLRAAL